MAAAACTPAPTKPSSSAPKEFHVNEDHEATDVDIARVCKGYLLADNCQELPGLHGNLEHVQQVCRLGSYNKQHHLQYARSDCLMSVSAVVSVLSCTCAVQAENDA